MISVIIPLYNNEKFIKPCLQSVINQSYKDIEIVIVNDGSTDNSLNIVEEIADRDNRIKIINQKNSGRSAARNIGIKNSSGDFLMFVDADDELEKNGIENLYKAINQENSDIAVGAVIINYDTHSELKENDDWYFSIRYNGIHDITDKLIEDIHCSVWGKIYRRSIIENNKLQFPEGLNYEDAYWHWVYLTSCNKISCIKNIVYKYFRRKDSIMSLTFENKENIAIQHLYIVEKIIEFWNQNKNLEEHYTTAAILFETYFWFAIKHSQKYERAKIAYLATRIARKYFLNINNNLINDIYNGDYSFLFQNKKDDEYENYLKFIQIISIFNNIFPRNSMRRKTIYTIMRYCYRVVKRLKF